MESSSIVLSDFKQPKSSNHNPQKSPKETCERIVVFLDIMGFKDMVARKKESAIIYKLEKLTNFIAALTAEKDILFHIFSDSIILFSDEVKDDTFEVMCNVTNQVVEYSIELGLPIKGAMSMGQCTVSTGLKQFYFGQPIIDAYLLEENVILYGVVLHNTVEEIAKNSINKKETHIFDDIVPLKGGSSKHFILNWFGQNHQRNINNLLSIRKTVSDSPRRYIDNTLSLIEKMEDKSLSVNTYNIPHKESLLKQISQAINLNLGNRDGSCFPLGK